jgi:hypothetical protein
MALVTHTDWPPFSSDAFLDVLRDVFFPGASKEVVECEGVLARTLVQANGKPIADFWQYPFYLEPLPQTLAPDRHAGYLDAVVQAVTDAMAPKRPGCRVAPFTDWRGFASWAEYASTRSSRPGVDSVATVLRKTRKLEREHGPLTFEFESTDRDDFEQVLAWKSLQYRRTGIADRFQFANIRRFYDEMWTRNMLTFSTLRAPQGLLAGNIANRIGGRMLSRLPAYDPRYPHYSAGSVLTLKVLEASYEAGDAEFDFLVGAEPYKFAFATHARWFGPLGQEPLTTRVPRVVRYRLSRQVQRYAAYRVYTRLRGRA